MPNKRIPARLAGAALTLFALGACVPRSAPPAPIPAPAPRPVPLPPPPQPRPAPVATDWQTGPLSPGDWSYRRQADTPTAIFQSEGMSLVLRCERRRTILLGILGAQADGLTIRTSFGERRLPATRAHLNEMLAELPAGDPLLDQMAFSRGRFLLAVEGGPSLVVPAWPEIGRVIEDCRGQ